MGYDLPPATQAEDTTHQLGWFPNGRFANRPYEFAGELARLRQELSDAGLS
jgi:hypothetical protein